MAPALRNGSAVRCAAARVQAVALSDAVAPEAAACFGIPALTAVHALQCHGGVRDKTVLIAGGAGAVGHYAVQFARLFGCATCLCDGEQSGKGRTGPVKRAPIP